MELDYRQFRTAWSGQVPLISAQAEHALTSVYEGDRSLLIAAPRAKGVYTFADLVRRVR
jgi:hypothetical protein